ncbi:phage tail tape measure protein [Campylobacter volucris]|uniref:Phage tail tape measure protein n=1 Tax=Campylobacter volucris TaxID=1031542 RepID=A0A5C7E451_9BACT|nr:phage tail tape measure protein [Campylobacter volucris]TXE87060.1 phage tail tape measure protein [Campylobacter volucris]
MENAGSIGIGVVLGLVTKNASAVGKIVKDFNNLEKIAAKTKLGINGLQKQLDTLKLNNNLREELKAQRKGLQDEILSLSNIIRGGIIGKGLGEAISFESAMADVKKVVNFDENDNIKKMSNDILKMSQTLPVTAKELAAIAAAGGQIGLGSKDVREFTTLVTKMKVAFDMSAEDVGESVAKIKNILGISLKDMQDLGDSINHLSDNSASKAKEIIEVMKRTAAAGKQVGFTKEQIAALSSSFISLGKGPEVAGTAINSLYRVLSTADNMGSKAEAAFTRLGISGAFLKQAMDDPQKGLNMFLERISKLDQKEQMGVLVDIFGREFADDMVTLVGGLDVYKKALKNASDEAKKDSLQREFDTRAKTTENSITLMKNAFNSLAINLGSVFLPAISGVSAGISYLVNGITYITGLIPWLNGILGGLIATFLLAKPIILAYAFAKNYVKDSTLLFKNALIAVRIHLLAFANSCNISKISLIGKAIALKLVRIRLMTSVIAAIIYKKAVIGLNLVLANLSKAFIYVARCIKILTITMLTNPLGIVLAAIGIIAGVIIANWDKVKIWFASFIEWLKPIFNPIVNIFNSIWQGISDFFYGIFGSMFEWFGDKLSWISKAIASVGNFINDVLGFFGLNDDEVKVSTNKQSEEKIINAYRDELPQTNEILETKSIKQIPINSTPSFNNGNINVTVNGTFNISTKDGNFNMQEFATAIQKSIFDALRKQEQNKINTTIYG